jgi:hypothetical protein
MGRMGWMSAFASSPSSPERGHIAPSLRSYPKSIHFMTLGYPHPFLGAILRPGGLFWKPLTQFPHQSRSGAIPRSYIFMSLGYSHPSLRAIQRPGSIFWKLWLQSPKLPRTRLHSSLAQDLFQDHTFDDLGVSSSLIQGHTTPRRPILEALGPVSQACSNRAT